MDHQDKGNDLSTDSGNLDMDDFPFQPDSADRLVIDDWLNRCIPGLTLDSIMSPWSNSNEVLVPSLRSLTAAPRLTDESPHVNREPPPDPQGPEPVPGSFQFKPNAGTFTEQVSGAFPGLSLGLIGLAEEAFALALKNPVKTYRTPEGGQAFSVGHLRFEETLCSNCEFCKEKRDKARATLVLNQISQELAQYNQQSTPELTSLEVENQNPVAVPTSTPMSIPIPSVSPKTVEEALDNPVPSTSTRNFKRDSADLPVPHEEETKKKKLLTVEEKRVRTERRNQRRRTRIRKSAEQTLTEEEERRQIVSENKENLVDETDITSTADLSFEALLGSLDADDRAYLSESEMCAVSMAEVDSMLEQFNNPLLPDVPLAETFPVSTKEATEDETAVETLVVAEVHSQHQREDTEDGMGNPEAEDGQDVQWTESQDAVIADTDTDPRITPVPFPVPNSETVTVSMHDRTSAAGLDDTENFVLSSRSGSGSSSPTMDLVSLLLDSDNSNSTPVPDTVELVPPLLGGDNVVPLAADTVTMSTPPPPPAEDVDSDIEIVFESAPRSGSGRVVNMPQPKGPVEIKLE